ncbi:MAG: DUF2461 domain-containing protein [Deltaproteobacteria bacterium]|nr:DUF2461 domain-containing protein [Deltaproteobacteria bacterium]
MQERSFHGFSKDSFSYLKNLKANNNKIWFETHKQEYQDFILKPLQNLVKDLGQAMVNIDPFLEISPKINKTISRIYRDTRFSKNKSPFKTTMWITFKRPDKKWQDTPTYFFEISPDSYRYGMGFYCASSDTAYRLRKLIDTDSKNFKKTLSLYAKQQTFIIEGEKYKKIFDKKKSEKIQDWYQRKSLYLVCNRNIDNMVLCKNLTDNMILDFSLIVPIYYFLWELKK